MSFPPLDDPRYTKRGALHVPAGDGITKWFAGDVYTFKFTASQTDGKLGMIEATVPPGGGPPAHVHNDSEETFYILSGELEFLEGDRLFIARPGDAVFCPRGIRHRFKNTGVHVARMLFWHNPGQFDDIFLEGGQDPVPGHMPAPMPLGDYATEQMNELITRHQAEVLPELP